MIKVVNKYQVKNHVYCGRGTALGNPFPMGSEADRNYVCNRYVIWFDHKIKSGDKDVLAALDNIINLASKGDVNLGCFCAPKRCHCDTIKVYCDTHAVSKPSF